MIVDSELTITNGIVRLIFGSKCIKVIVIDEIDEPVTLGRFLDIAISSGYEHKKPYEPLTIIWEDCNCGAVYRYDIKNNDVWQKLGDLRGFI